MLYHFPVTTHLWWIANILLIKNNICTIYHPLKRKKKKKDLAQKANPRRNFGLSSL